MGMPLAVDYLMATGMGLFMALLIPSFIYPITIITTIVISAWMFIIEKYIINCIKASSKLNSNTTSDVIHELVSIVDGVQTIRAYKREDVFLTRWV